MSTDNWRNLDRFPRANGDWQFCRPPLRKVHSGKKKIEKSVSNWHIYDPLIVATQTSTRFLPPVCMPEYQDEILSNLKQKSTLLVLGAIFALVLYVAQLTYLSLPIISDKIVHVFFLAIIGLVLDRYLIINNKKCVTERSLFFHWIFSEKNNPLKIFVLMMVIASAYQLFHIFEVCSFEDLIIRYGVYFPATERGEIWRYFIGPFFHASFQHWALNFVMGFIAVGLASTILKKLVILKFFTCLIFSIIAAEYLTLTTPIEGFVGVSGGIFGLFGWMVTHSAKNKNDVPQHFWLSLLCFSLFNLLFSSISSENSSLTAHLAGFGLGLLLGLCPNKKRASIGKPYVIET